MSWCLNESTKSMFWKKSIELVLKYAIFSERNVSQIQFELAGISNYMTSKIRVFYCMKAEIHTQVSSTSIHSFAVQSITFYFQYSVVQAHVIMRHVYKFVNMIIW